MEPVTHMLTGAVLSRAGLNRRAAYMTFAMVIAAEFPDIDTLWSLGGPLTGFEHHRGITHTFVALPFEAALITLYFYVTHRFRKQSAKREQAPPNWLWMFTGTLVALLSHLLLDWTNNYGLRPFFPFNPRWYAGSFVFIFEPILFAILLLALMLPPLFGLINSEISSQSGTRRQRFRGRPAAIVALVAVAILYLFRYTEHARALQLAAVNAAPEATRFFASPPSHGPLHVVARHRYAGGHAAFDGEHAHRPLRAHLPAGHPLQAAFDAPRPGRQAQPARPRLSRLVDVPGTYGDTGQYRPQPLAHARYIC